MFSLNLLGITQLQNQFRRIRNIAVGGVAEWSNAPVLKTDEGESPPRVRIPVPPPLGLLAG